MLSEIKKIPGKTLEIFEKNRDLQLPQKVYYLGLGASYHAPLVLRYCGKQLYPEVASEFNHYLHQKEKLPLGILISLNSDNRLILPSRSFFYEYIAIINNRSNKLSDGENLLQMIDIGLTEDVYRSSLPYLSLLIVLYRGLGLDCFPAIEYIRKDFDFYEAKGRLMAEEIEKFFKRNTASGIYILGNGPNIATAKQAAMLLTRVTNRPFIGMSIAHFDHLFKNHLRDRLTIIINDNGPGKDIASRFGEKLKEEDSKCIFVEEIDLSWIFTPINLILPFDFAAYYLSQKHKWSKVSIPAS
jgi:glucosamine--fructose-6-phosphate aminotransferase (isomerizing)